MYPLIESIKIKNRFAYNLSLHQKRMDMACNAFFGKACSIELYECLNTVNLPDDGLYKCRISYGDGGYEKETELYFPKKIDSLKLVYSDEIDYTYKYADRTALSKLLDQKGKADEIIIVKNGLITDTSYANLIFWDGKKWDTPSIPLLKGIQREKLLGEGIIYETEIRPSDIKRYKKIALINAMLDFDDKIVVPVKKIF